MVSAFLIVSIVIMAPLVLFGCLLLLVYFGHPDDKNEAWIPKIVTVLGLWLSFASILALPYDVSNARGEGGGIRVDVLWQIIYISIAIMVSVVIPFAFFYYESDDEDSEEDKGFCATQFCNAMKYTFAFFAVFAFLLGILYGFINVAEIPVRRIIDSYTSLQDITNTTFRSDGRCNDPEKCVADNFTWEVPITFPVYVMGFLAFFGWFMFTLFAGVGLIALPLDLINEWRTRPVPMSHTEYVTKRKELGQRAKKLIEIGDKLVKDMGEFKPDRRTRNQTKATLKKFETAYYFLKQDYEVLRISFKEKGGNPVWYFFKLVLGLAGGVISITWIIHIAIFVLPRYPVHPFLNNFFIQLEEVGGGGFPLFGIVAFAIYGYWLLWCVIKGNFRFGARFFFFKLYPMELNNTLMNAFLFNTWLILVCSVPTLMFCVRAFPIYSRLTEVDLLFGTQVQYLRFFRYFWTSNAFIWSMIIISFFTALLLFFRPRDKAKEIEAKLAAVQRGNSDD